MTCLAAWKRRIPDSRVLRVERLYTMAFVRRASYGPRAGGYSFQYFRPRRHVVLLSAALRGARALLSPRTPRATTGR